MATTIDYVEYICEQVRGVGAVRHKKMFGEYMVYLDDKPILLICDNTVFVKMLPCLDALMKDAEKGLPYKGAKEHYVLDIDNAPFAREVVKALLPVTPLPKPRKKKPSGLESIDPIGAYIAAQDAGVQPRLREVYAAIKGVLPDAKEKLGYQMPTFWDKRNLIHFAAFKQHIGLYPGPEAIAYFADRLTKYQTSKGAIQFLHSQPLPLDLIADIAAWCAKAAITRKDPKETVARR